MDRKAQRKLFTDSIQPFFTAQDQSDAAADKSGKTRAALSQATIAYNRAKQTGPASLVEALASIALGLQAQDAKDTADAQTAYLVSEATYVTLDNSEQVLLQNPGLVEQV